MLFSINVCESISSVWTLTSLTRSRDKNVNSLVLCFPFANPVRILGSVNEIIQTSPDVAVRDDTRSARSEHGSRIYVIQKPIKINGFKNSQIYFGKTLRLNCTMPYKKNSNNVRIS